MEYASVANYDLMHQSTNISFLMRAHNLSLMNYLYPFNSNTLIF